VGFRNYKVMIARSGEYCGRESAMGAVSRRGRSSAPLHNSLPCAVYVADNGATNRMRSPLLGDYKANQGSTGDAGIYRARRGRSRWRVGH
jgi:hypothetical protein